MSNKPQGRPPRQKFVKMSLTDGSYANMGVVWVNTDLVCSLQPCETSYRGDVAAFVVINESFAVKESLERVLVACGQRDKAET